MSRKFSLCFLPSTSALELSRRRCRDEALDLLIILVHADIAVGARRKEPGHFDRVVLPDLHRQHSARREMCRGSFDESSNEGKTVGPSVKRTERIVPDLALQTRKLRRGNVWQVGDNPVEAFPLNRKEIRFVKSDPFTHRVPRGVFLCEAQRFGRKVCRGYAGEGKLQSHCDCDDTRARADIEEA